MGRELRRVPMDFDWPLGEVWGGYLMSDDVRLTPCPDCGDGKGGGTAGGMGPEAAQIYRTFWPHEISWNYSDVAREHGEKLAWHDKLGQVEVDHLVAEELTQGVAGGSPSLWVLSINAEVWREVAARRCFTDEQAETDGVDRRRGLVG